MNRNIAIYPWYLATFGTHFWLPAFFLYFNSLFSVEEVLLLEAIYYGSVVLLEVPSGYLSDRVGRRPTLLISSIALLVSYALFFFGTDFWSFCLAQVGFAAAIAFNSGSDVSIHYDSLVALGKESEFPEREGKAASIVFFGGAIGALFGGIVASYELRYAYGLSFMAAIVTLGLTLFFREPENLSKKEMKEGFLSQIRICVSFLKDFRLLWLFLFAVYMTIVNHIPYEFYQPYIKLLFEGSAWQTQGTPLSSGIHAAIAMVIASIASRSSIALRDRFGTTKVLLLSAAIQCLIIIIMSLYLNAIIAVLIVFRSLPRGLMRAPLNAAINPLLPSEQRATYLSIQSLVGRLSFCLTLMFLSSVASSGDEVSATWEILSQVLQAASGVAIVGLTILILLSKKASFQNGVQRLQSE